MEFFEFLGRKQKVYKSRLNTKLLKRAWLFKEFSERRFVKNELICSRTKLEEKKKKARSTNNGWVNNEDSRLKLWVKVNLVWFPTFIKWVLVQVFRPKWMEISRSREGGWLRWQDGQSGEEGQYWIWSLVSHDSRNKHKSDFYKNLQNRDQTVFFSV